MAVITSPRPIARAVFALSFTLALVGLRGGQARADDAGAPPSAEPARPAEAAPKTSTCALRGTFPVTKGTPVFDAEAGGRVVATFSGAFSPLTLTELPADAAKGRARVQTTLGGGAAFRIDGYVAPSGVRLFTTRELAVASAHVWLSSGKEVRLARADGDALAVELTIAGSDKQTVRTIAPCDALALERPPAAPFEVPGHARGYLMKKATIDLYDAPRGSAVFQIRMTEGTGQLFWSTEAKLGFVHVMSRSDLTVDAWARLSELEPLRKGELMDQLIAPETAVTGAQLGFEKEPTRVRATQEIPIRARRDAKDKPIGQIEVGAELYLLETIAGWTNVLPKGLGIIPPEGEGFWIPVSEVPKPAPPASPTPPASP